MSIDKTVESKGRIRAIRRFNETNLDVFYTLRDEGIIVATICKLNDGWAVFPNNQVRKPSRKQYETPEAAAKAFGFKNLEWVNE